MVYQHYLKTTTLRNTTRRIVERHPYISSGILVVSGGISYACITEYNAERNESKWINEQPIRHYDHHPPTMTTINHVSATTNDSAVATLPPPLLPRYYDWDQMYQYWSIRPVTTMSRIMQIAYELTPLVLEYVLDFVILPTTELDDKEKQRRLAIKFRESLTNLGPAFIKAGQQLSIRPDLVSAVVLKELQVLCDAVRPIPDEVAIRLIQEQLDVNDLCTVFENTPQLVASASLGQVYKATLRHTNEDVAIKVQRPNMIKSFSLDLFLLQHIGIIVDRFTSMFTNQLPFHKKLYESFAVGSYSELDYENEAKNQMEFYHEFKVRNCPVVVPKVYYDYTTRYVLTTEWIDGIKLSDAPNEQIRQLIPIGVELFLTQLLDLGKFHSDPHPGNLLVNRQGQLCLLDYGLCADVDIRARKAMTKAIVHLMIKDFDTLISSDAKELGFLPDDYDTTELKPILTKILTVGLLESGTSNIKHRSRKLMEISNELNEVFFRYPFSVPPFFALVTRGLGLLEGIALSGDPEFDIFRASAPYARKRAVTLLGAEEYYQLLTRRRTF